MQLDNVDETDVVVETGSQGRKRLVSLVHDPNGMEVIDRTLESKEAYPKAA